MESFGRPNPRERRWCTWGAGRRGGSCISTIRGPWDEEERGGAALRGEIGGNKEPDGRNMKGRGGRGD